MFSINENMSPFNGNFYNSSGGVSNILELGESLSNSPTDNMSPFNGNFYNSSRQIQNLIDLGEAPDNSPINNMSPFNGDFYASDGSIHNIDELLNGGERSSPDFYKIVDFPEVLRTGTMYMFTSITDEVFISSSVANSGVWWLDRKKEKMIQVYPSGQGWLSWFETSTGEIFAWGTAATAPGLLRWNGAEFIQVYAGYGWSAIDEFSGNVLFASSNSASPGLLQWDGSKITNIKSGYGWKVVERLSSDNVLLGSINSVSSGLLQRIGSDIVVLSVNGFSWSKHNFKSGLTVLYPKDGGSVTDVGIFKLYQGAVTRVYHVYKTTHLNEPIWFETSKGDIFMCLTSSMGSGSDIGILRWADSEFVIVHSSGYYSTWIETINGEIFVSSGAMYATGVLHWSGSEFVKVYPSGYGWTSSFKSSSGELFIWGTSSTSVGLIHWNGVMFDLVHAIGYSWSNWFESSTGELFVSSASSSYAGILRWNGSEFVQAHSTASGASNWFESSIGEIYTNSSSGILKLSGTEFVLVYSGSGGWNLWAESSTNKLFVASTTASRLGILYFDGVSFVPVYASGYYWQAFIKASNGDVYFTTTASSRGDGLLYWNGTELIVLHPTTYNWRVLTETSTGKKVVAGMGLWTIDDDGPIKLYDTGAWDVLLKRSPSNILFRGTGLVHWNGKDFIVVTSVGGSSWTTGVDLGSDTFIYCTVATGVGIFRMDEDTCERVYDSGYNWKNWFKTSAGELFVSNSVNTNILKWSGSGFVQVFTVSGNGDWSSWFESSTGEIFACAVGSSGGTGILYWNGVTFIKVYSTANWWTKWFESSDGGIFTSFGGTGGTTAVGFLRWNGSAFIQILAHGYGWTIEMDSANKITITSADPAGLLEYDKKTTNFSIPVPNYSNVVFKDKYTLSNFHSTVGQWISDRRTSKYVLGNFTTRYENGLALNSDKTKLLYIIKEAS